MKTVLLERTLPQGFKPGDEALPELPICCSTGLLEWGDSFITTDGSRAYLIARAPDLETIRMAVRQCHSDVRWKYQIHDEVLNDQLAT